MRVETTKTMCKAMQHKINLDCIDRIEYHTASLDRFHFNICSEWYTSEKDYTYDRNGYHVGKYIAVFYKPEFYAMPKYITQKDLDQVFRHCDKTFDGFFKELERELEI